MCRNYLIFFLDFDIVGNLHGNCLGTHKRILKRRRTYTGICRYRIARISSRLAHRSFITLLNTYYYNDRSIPIVPDVFENIIIETFVHFVHVFIRLTWANINI